jgi:hypothetical protein
MGEILLTAFGGGEGTAEQFNEVFDTARELEVAESFGSMFSRFN